MNLRYTLIKYLVLLLFLEGVWKENNHKSVIHIYIIIKAVTIGNFFHKIEGILLKKKFIDSNQG